MILLSGKLVDWNGGEASVRADGFAFRYKLRFLREQGTKAKIATSCGNAFVTNIMLASDP